MSLDHDTSTDLGSRLVAAFRSYLDAPNDETRMGLIRACTFPLSLTDRDECATLDALVRETLDGTRGHGEEDREYVLSEAAWLDMQLRPTGNLRDADSADDDDPASAGLLTARPARATHQHNGHADVGEVLHSSLYPVDLGPVLAGTSAQPMPSQLVRDDGASLLYSGSVNGFHADSGIGKGWIVCHLMQQNALHGVRTMLLDFEDTAHSITARLRLLGMSDHDITTWVVYVRPEVAVGGLAVAHLVNTIRGENAGAVVLDSLGEAFGLAGVNEDRDNEVGPWLRMATRPLADTGASVTMIDHSTKAGTNDLHPSGSKRKRAAITGASYLVEAVKPFVKGEGGRLRVTCAKDRHGNYRRGGVVADLVMDSTDLGVRLKLYAPTITTAEGDATVPIILAARKAVAAAKDAGRPLSRNELEARMAVKGRAQMKRAGIDHAVAEGALGEQRGARNSRLFTWCHDLEEAT